MSQKIPSTGSNFIKTTKFFANDTLNAVTQFQRELGDFFEINLGFKKIYYTTNPEYVKQLLQTNQKNYIKSKAVRILKDLVGEGLLTTEGEQWKKQRQLTQPSFYKESLEQLFATMEQETDAHIRKLEEGQDQEIIIDEEMMVLAMNIVTRGLMGSEVSIPNMGESMDFMLMHLIKRFRSPVYNLMRFLNGNEKEYGERLQALEEVVQELIDKRRMENEAGTDLLNMLIMCRDAETGEALSNKEVQDQVMTFFLAGHETSANALSWCLYLLAQHPEELEKVRQEADAVFNSQRQAGMKDLSKMEYTRQVIYETMRLYPPVWSFGRESLEADQFGPYQVPAGSSVIISVYCLHRHPDLWEEPEVFKPERFEAEAMKQRPKFHYIPFGAGPRMCIGNNFAMMEMMVAICKLVQHFDFELSEKEVMPQGSMTLRPKKAMRFKLRNRVMESI